MFQEVQLETYGAYRCPEGFWVNKLRAFYSTSHEHSDEIHFSITFHSHTSGAAGVQCLAQGHFNMWTGEVGDWTHDPVIRGWPAVPVLNLFLTPFQTRVSLNPTQSLRIPSDSNRWSPLRIRLKIFYFPKDRFLISVCWPRNNFTYTRSDLDSSSEVKQ